MSIYYYQFKKQRDKSRKGSCENNHDPLMKA